MPLEKPLARYTPVDIHNIQEKRRPNDAWEAVRLFNVALRHSKRDGMIVDVGGEVDTLELG
jgi:hypothetical protein